MTKDDWGLAEKPAKEVTVTPSTEITAPDERELLRRRIEAEELAKYEEEKMRAEIRARLQGQDIPTSPVPAAPTPAAPQPIIINVDNSNNNSNIATATAVVNARFAVRQKPPTIIRALYFLFVGCWAGVLWVSVAAILCATVVGLPLGLQMFRHTEQAFFL